MRTQKSPNAPLVEGGIKAAELYLQIGRGIAPPNPFVQNAFWGLLFWLSYYGLEQAEAEELMPYLLETAKEASIATMVLPQAATIAAMRQLGEQWLYRSIEDDFWGWSHTKVCNGVIVVASDPIIGALGIGDLRALQEFGGNTLAALGMAGVNFGMLYAEANGLDPNESYDVDFLNVSAHPVDCVCSGCRFRDVLAALAELRLAPEDYLIRLLTELNMVADELADDSEGIQVALTELCETLGFFLKSNLQGLGHSDVLLHICNRLFKSFEKWLDEIVYFLHRYPPCQPLADWCHDNGWAYIAGENPQIVSLSMAKKQIIPEEDALGSLDQMIGYFRSMEEIGGDPLASI